MINDYKKVKQMIDMAMMEKKAKLDKRLLDFLKYRQLWGKKRSDDDLSDLAIKQWTEEGRDVSAWTIK